MTQCRCKSYNRPDLGGDVDEVTVSVPHHLREQMDGKHTVCLDLCISHLVLALWAKDIPTLNSCCGHNGAFPRAIVVSSQHAVTAQSIIARMGDASTKILFWEGGEMRSGMTRKDELKACPYLSANGFCLAPRCMCNPSPTPPDVVG